MAPLDRMRSKTGSAPPYSATLKARSLYVVSVAVFMAFLATVFFLSRDPIFVALGVFLSVLVGSVIYGFIKNEASRIHIEDGVFSWSHPRWPKSSGRIDLATVRRIAIDDGPCSICFTFDDGSSKEMRFIGPGSGLRDYLQSNFPKITVDFERGT